MGMCFSVLWRPIATVPKNEPVIIAVDNVVQFSTYVFDGETWFTYDSEEQVHDGNFKPSHWMPMPPPPYN